MRNELRDKAHVFHRHFREDKTISGLFLRLSFKGTYVGVSTKQEELITVP